MSKIAQYLGQHLSGEVVTTAAARRYFSTDGSIFEALPQLVVYPKNTNDVRRVARLAWQLAEKGHKLPITPRGLGTDQSGAAIGRGIAMVFPAHMNRLLHLDTGKGLATVQPGMNYRGLQDVLMSHGLFLPPFPASIDYSSIGGAIANNSAGEKSLKYGDTRKYVKALQVVLANGDVIEVKRLNKRELSRKMGQTDFEGEIYRQIDGLLSDQHEQVTALAEKLATSKNSSGYALTQVKQKDTFDLTPLFVGAQGTLGIITEATLEVEGYNAHTTLIAAQFASLEQVTEAIHALQKCQPSALELVDKNLLEFVAVNAPGKLKSVVTEPPLPEFLLLIEFDDPSDRARKKQAKKAIKLITNLAAKVQEANDFEEQQELWAIRRSAAASVLWQDQNGAQALPLIEDGIVPREQFGAYVAGVQQLFAKHKLKVAMWGHAGDANLHMQPFLDLSKLTDRQKAFKLMDEYYALIASLGGAMAAEHGDGRLRGPYLEQFYGKEIYGLFQRLKQIFDPYDLLNPGVKVNSSKAEAMAMIRSSYNLAHLSGHLPRS